MVDALVAALAVLLWLVTLVNVAAYRRTRAVTRAWLVGIFALLALAASLCVSAVTVWLSCQRRSLLGGRDREDRGHGRRVLCSVGPSAN